MKDRLWNGLPESIMAETGSAGEIALNRPGYFAVLSGGDSGKLCSGVLP